MKTLSKIKAKLGLSFSKPINNTYFYFNIFLLNRLIKYNIKKYILFCVFTATIGVLLLSCNWSEHKNEKLQFKPVLNQVYHFSFTKNRIQSWTYQTVPYSVYDTVQMDFSLQKINSKGTPDTCKFTLHSFTWKGKAKVDYHRDSLHALSINIIISDSGKIEAVQNMNNLTQDIIKDSSTGKYLSGLIPDHVSSSAITDMLTRFFSVIPGKKVKPNETWITNTTLSTNHPVNFSNFNRLISRSGDTADIEIQSNIFARRSPGDEYYIKGNQNGEALINYSTGILYSYKTKSETITTTSYYDIKVDEDISLLQMDKQIKLDKKN